MIVSIYLRKSRAEDINDTVEQTLQRHKQILLEFAKNNNLIVKNTYEEVVSGESLYSRPQMLKMLSDIESGMYDAVLCMDIDRLGRGTMSEQGIILETFKTFNTKIITPHKTYDLNNEFDEEYSEFESFMARRELKLINRRMRRGVRRSVEEGAYLSNAPYGYTNTVVNRKSTLKINEQEAYFVRLIFNMYVNKNNGCQMIADTINSMGAKPHRSNKFCRTSIMHILKNNVYIGKVVWDKKSYPKKGRTTKTNHAVINSPEKWIVVDGIHPAIIEPSIFYKAQDIISKKYHPPYYNGEIKNPLAGTIKCAICGSSMQRRAYSHNNCVQLLCPTKACVRSTGLCYIEDSVINVVKGVLKSIGIIVKNQQETQDCDSTTTAIKLLEKQKSSVLNQIERVHELLENNVYDIETYNERLSILSNKLKGIEKTYNNLIKYINKTNNRDNHTKKIENVLEAYNLSDVPTKNNLLKSILISIYYYKAKDWNPNQFELIIEIVDLGVYHE